MGRVPHLLFESRAGKNNRHEEKKRLSSALRAIVQPVLMPHTELANITPLIRTIRGHRVILDTDLAKLDGVPRFPLQ